jgi:hypothetical protein
MRVANYNNNKPPLRRDLVPGLQEKYSDKAEEKSIVLQRQLLDYVQCYTKDFTSAIIDYFLYEYPDTHNDKYAERFKHAGWQALLLLILDFAGPTL